MSHTCEWFIEWQEVEGVKKTIPWNIHRMNPNEIFSFAGIWNMFPDKVTGLKTLCAFIITTEANEKMRTIHNKGGNKFRQPVIIEKENYSSWLNSGNIEPDSIYPLMKQFATEDFSYTPLEKVGDDIKGIPPIVRVEIEKKKDVIKSSKKKEEQSVF